MRSVNFLLIRKALLVLFLTFGALARPVLAQDDKAVPVPAVESEKLAPEVFDVLGQGPVVLELFSSQACIFCPQADRLFADMAQQVNVIGLACHVDYFDVRVGALSQPFCSARQDWYMKVLHGGPNYTPQLVVQGRHDAAGNKIPAITAALKKAATEIPPAIATEYAGQSGHYRLQLPALVEDKHHPYKLTLMVYDSPHNVVIGEGRNKGQKMTYAKIVSALQDLGTWNGEADMMEVEIERNPGQQGFAILAQDEKTGTIAAAGRYNFQAQKQGDSLPPGPAPNAYHE